MTSSDKLLAGIVKFRKEDYEAHKELFQSLGTYHNPHTLFIACSDSRLMPGLITKSLPGELFNIRNIANIVPPYRETGEFVATTSAIEYAVKHLDVERIIVCGHSNCGGCSACLNGERDLFGMPHTKKWLELAEPVRERVLNSPYASDRGFAEWMMEQENVLEQLKHLLTYPFIAERVSNGTLTLEGWYYVIETGEIFTYDRKNQAFILANDNKV
ncbi:MAG TPA: carbonic anhydrase [Candidatus Avacidaminococcus intestinavium]|uniref:Carbonic anhydrase n=1 Tax=Candidatus Avacidaminococcus intestinavium TaxID=2840684 RepID=A0A9D1MQ52_9FIRM|nr:carbonic anhydrase [Candidatus Avacidaminococcus intestinavium]